MNKFMNWMTNVFSPKVNKFAKNTYIASIQDAILSAIPMLFIGSFATILSIISSYWKWFPDFTNVSQFSFGLFSVFIAYLLPEAIMRHKKQNDVAKQAGLAGLAFFLILVYPTINTNTSSITFNINTLGTGGMIAALISGIFVGWVMGVASKYKFFGEDSALPDFVTVWFNTLLPIIVILIIGWLFTFELKINLYSAINSLFNPLVNLGQSFWGMVIISFLAFSFLYSFGISSWVLYPVQTAICLPAIAQNAEAAANGHAAINLFTNESVNLFLIGGGGTTLALVIMMAFLAKAPRLRAIGKAALVPGIFNINEPVVFGAPIAFNPILMVPFWIMGLIGPCLVWFAEKIGAIPIPTHLFQLWYLPFPILAWLTTRAVSTVLFVIVLFVISWIIYWPFFKVYDRQVVKEDVIDS